MKGIEVDFNSYLIVALERVLAWDLPDEACPQAVIAEAQLLAGADPESAEGFAD